MEYLFGELTPLQELGVLSAKGFIYFIIGVLTAFGVRSSFS